MSSVVYVLCALTSLACAWLLLRSYSRSSSRLLFWSGLCFIGLTVNNVLLFVDLVLIPEGDLTIPRDLTTLASMSLLIFGLVWETE